MLTLEQEEFHRYEVALQRMRLYHMLQDAVNKGLLKLPPDINFQLECCKYALERYHEAEKNKYNAD